MIPPRSRGWTSRALRCATCRELIEDQQPHWAIEYETYRWAVHDVCP
ncbi:hypothetical protein [Streptomyces venezuelae]|nr:hypothetical protein [Streptomyces venezuelae]